VFSLALKPFRKRRDAAIAILHPPEERVFDFRVREPYPGIRVFGCFAEKDVFGDELGAERSAADRCAAGERCGRMEAGETDLSIEMEPAFNVRTI
jgi:hypothetical protein